MSAPYSKIDWAGPAKKLARTIFTYGDAKYAACTRLQYMSATRDGKEEAYGGLCESALAMVIEDALRAGVASPKNEQAPASEMSVADLAKVNFREISDEISCARSTLCYLLVGAGRGRTKFSPEDAAKCPQALVRLKQWSDYEQEVMQGLAEHFGAQVGPKKRRAFSLENAVAEALERNASARDLSVNDYVNRLIRADLVRAKRRDV